MIQQIILGTDVNLPMVETAIREGEARVIALVLSNAGQLQTVTANIPAVLKTLSEKRAGGLTRKKRIEMRQTLFDELPVPASADLPPSPELQSNEDSPQRC